MLLPRCWHTGWLDSLAIPVAFASWGKSANIASDKQQAVNGNQLLTVFSITGDPPLEIDRFWGSGSAPLNRRARNGQKTVAVPGGRNSSRLVSSLED